MSNYYVYILTNKTDAVLYIGVTNNLERRLYEHREGITGGFSSKYKTYKLIYFEIFSDSVNAITREKQLKNWRRDKKDYLIDLQNPEWIDLSERWYEIDSSISLRSTRNDHK